MRGAVYRLQRATGTDERITGTMRPVASNNRGIRTERAYQLYEWMQKQGVIIKLPPTRTTPMDSKVSERVISNLVDQLENRAFRRIIDTGVNDG